MSIDLCITWAVHYRIGSLEKLERSLNKFHMVHYRIGSLEKYQKLLVLRGIVHYRIGSLEIKSD